MRHLRARSYGFLMLPFFLACGGASPTSSSTGAHATGVGGPTTASGTTAAKMTSASTRSGGCKMSQHPATMSPSLDDWPAFPVGTAADVTSSLGVTTTSGV